MAWRLAKSLLVLLAQINALYPDRVKGDDGTIGDLRHQASTSDHNPDSAGRVCALDVTHDPKHGFNSYDFADMLIRNRDPRIKYVISNRRIAGNVDYARRNGTTPWVWHPYSGSNPHDRHVHVSVNAANADRETPWVIDGITKPDPAAPDAPSKPKLLIGSTGTDVAYVQTLLGINSDGYFGPVTKQAVVAFQVRRGLVTDGIVGQYTWGELAKGETLPTDLNLFTNITATIFGGAAQDERSAYDGHRITETELAVALPFRFPGPRPKVQVQANGKTVTATIEDVGPWNVDDPYWLNGLRPQAETGTDKTGRRTNRAGIDLSPAVARALGVDGLGRVDWCFLE